jgi:hypothetical protein
LTSIDANTPELQAHPAAAVFPQINGPDFDALCADIDRHGLVEPIVLHDGMILDGRNRYRACRALGIDPVFVEWNGAGTPEAFVISRNIVRRHLSTDQRKECARMLLKNNPDASARAVGKATNLSPTTVLDIMKENENNEISESVQNGHPGDQPAPVPRPGTVDIKSERGKHGIVTPDGVSVEQWVRAGMALHDEGENSESVAKKLGIGVQSYRNARYVVLLADRRDLSADERGIAADALTALNEARLPGPAFAKVSPIVDRIWGLDSKAQPQKTEKKRAEHFDNAIGAAVQACIAVEDVRLPDMDCEQREAAIADLKTAQAALRRLCKRLKEVDQ